MKQYVLMIVAAAVLATSALASTPKEVHCAVMHDHLVNIKDATAHHMYADYHGQRYFFCCAGCPATFKKSPAKFAKADHIPVPKK